MTVSKMPSATLGAALIVGYTAAITVADAVTKHLALQYEAPQILVICAFTILVAICFGSAYRGEKLLPVTKAPRAMVLRAFAAVAGATLFYYAFRLLPFADVFLFIALVPILAGVLSSPVLREQVTPRAWFALLLASCGVYVLFPSGAFSLEIAQPGHLVALGAALCGTLAVMTSRFIARVDDNVMPQVFYPQLATLLVSMIAAPFVWVPMTTVDVALTVACGGVLFSARYLLALSMTCLPAYAATPLMNLQFVWMVGVGVVIFNEIPATTTFLGAGLIIVAGLAIVADQVLGSAPLRLRTRWLASRA